VRHENKVREVVHILMGSKFYFDLSLQERYDLIRSVPAREIRSYKTYPPQISVFHLRIEGIRKALHRANTPLDLILVLSYGAFRG
jgi:hypothetical protein